MNKGMFLIEIGTEELPYKELNIISHLFYTSFIKELTKFNFTYNLINNYYSSRRISLKIHNLHFKKDINKINNFKIFNNDIIKINKKNKINNIKNHIKYIQNNIYIHKILILVVKKVINKIKTIKYMRWGDGNNKFIRPVHSLLIMLDSEVINTNIFDIKSSRITFGHRFIGQQKIILKHVNEYPKILFEKGKVIIDHIKRKKKIRMLILNEINKINGKIKSEEKLIDEIATLVEWPIVLTGSFKKKYLNIPKEILTYIMKILYKFIPVYDDNDKLLSYFIFIINIETKDYTKLTKDYEFFLHSRFKDVEFLLKQDSKNLLEFHYLSLHKILFHEKLGTMLEKTNRIKDISHQIAKQINLKSKHIKRAAILSKCDLLTKMVFEFPDMQGIIGMHYALNNNEDRNVAISLKEQYYPNYFSTKIPSNPVSSILSISDKIDNLVGMIGINIYPKGGNDPFGLRRSAIGIIKIILYNKLTINIKEIISQNKLLFNNCLINKNVINDVYSFLIQKMVNLYKINGHNESYIKSIINKKDVLLTDIDKKIFVISSFYKSDILNKIILTSKRIFKILLKSHEKKNKKINKYLLKHKEEILLVNKLSLLKKKINKFLNNKDYKNIIFELLFLSKIINNYFDKVMINDPIEIIRINRLSILYKSFNLFSCICDLSVINTK